MAGNDDYACLSAWYTFGALGFYPVTGMDWYYLGSPVNDRVRGLQGPPCPHPTPVLAPVLTGCGVEPCTAQTTLNLANGATFEVVAINNSPTNVYVERITLNGVDLTTPYITHAQIVAGGTLTFYMSSTADTAFNANNDEARRWAARKAEIGAGRRA